MTQGNGAVLFDANGNALQLSAGSTVTSSQPGLVVSGSDYASTPAAQIPKVDKYGTLYTSSANPAGGSSQFYAGQASPAAASQYGTLIMARQDSPTPSTIYPVTLDQTGAVQAHLKSKVTFTVSAWNVTCGTNKILFALQNGSTMVLRINRCSVYIPPAGGTGGALLGQGAGQTYYPVYCDLRRASSYTGGTAITPVPSDSADVLSSGITCAKAVTSTSGTDALFFQADAYATNLTGIPFYERGADANAKTFVIRPGECAYVICTSNGTVNSTTAGGGTVTASANLMVTFTQASS